MKRPHGTKRFGLPGENTARVKALLAEGLSNKEIAQRLNISIRLTAWHVQKLYREAGLFGTASYRRLIVWILKGKTPETK